MHGWYWIPGYLTDVDYLFSFGTFVVALAATWVAWEALKFAKHEIGVRAELETFSKSQDAAAAMLLAGYEAMHQRGLVLLNQERMRNPNLKDLFREKLIVAFQEAHSAMQAFEGRAQVLGAYFPDREPIAYEISRIARAFSKAVPNVGTSDELSTPLVRLRLDLGPFIRGPNHEEIEVIVRRGSEEFEKYRATSATDSPAD